MDKVDLRDQFETIVTKWKKTSTVVMNVNFSLHMRNGLACKDKWGSIYGRFKKISNHISRTSWNENHCDMNVDDKISHHLPWLFNKIHYDLMLEFMGKRPMFRPLYTQNLMQDANNIHHSIRILEPTINEWINMSGNGVNIENVFCGYEDLSKGG